jgi:SanA protein
MKVSGRRMKKIALFLFLMAALVVVLVIYLNTHIHHSSEKYISKNINVLPFSYTVLVLGAHVQENGQLSFILKDRVDRALELYKAHKVCRFLLSGDHGRKKYDEVNTMKRYLINKGVPQKDIFLDHAGFDTYSSLVRAKKVFDVKSVIIVSQLFHLPRAVYIARKIGLNAYGCPTANDFYERNLYYKFRESLADMKAYFSLMINLNPRFLGNKIPITGDSRKSYD